MGALEVLKQISHPQLIKLTDLESCVTTLIFHRMALSVHIVE